MRKSVFRPLQQWFSRTWKIGTVIITVTSSVTALNVKIHSAMQDTARAQIADSIKSAMKEALADMNGRITNLDDKVYRHERSIAQLEAKSY